MTYFRYLITGGSGFLGQALIERLLKNQYAEIIVVARNEGKLIELKQRFPTIEIVTGNIADRSICERAIKDCCGVFHLAGFKHVGWAESQPMQCIETNITGTLNILSAAALQKIDFVIGTSTDKAGRISGVYGATKFLMEKLFYQFEQFNSSTKFRIVRYGNVIYSTGSVLEKWRKALRLNEPITITDENTTRFYWTVEQAVDLIFECLSLADNSMPYCPKMKAIRLGDLLDCMREKYAVGTPKIRTIGIQNGENQHETMDGHVFSNQVERYTREEIMTMI